MKTLFKYLEYIVLGITALFIVIVACVALYFINLAMIDLGEPFFYIFLFCEIAGAIFIINYILNPPEDNL